MHAELPRFTGSVEHALDDKSRLIVPARFRERLGAGFVLTIARTRPLPGALSERHVGRRLQSSRSGTAQTGKLPALHPSSLCPHRGSRVRRTGPPRDSRPLCARMRASSATSFRSAL